MAKVVTQDVLGKMQIDSANVALSLREYSESARVFSNALPRLIDQYENHWVCVYKGSVAATATTLSTLNEKIDAAHIPSEDAVVRYIDREPKTLVI